MAICLLSTRPHLQLNALSFHLSISTFEESKISISSNLEIQSKFERILIDEHQNIGIIVEIANFHSKLFGFYREMDEFNDTKCSAPMAQKEMASHTIRMK